MDRRAVAAELGSWGVFALALAACGPEGGPGATPQLQVRPASIRLLPGRTVTATIVVAPDVSVVGRLDAANVRAEPEARKGPGRVVLTFEPRRPRYVQGTWTLTATRTNERMVVPVRATTYRRARIRSDGPTTRDVGAVAPGARVHVALRNEGARAASVQLTAQPPARLLGASTVEIEALTSTSIPVELRPSYPGPFGAPVFASTGTSTVEIWLRGRAVAPELAAQPSALAFGAWVVGAETEAELRLWNRGGGLLRVETLELSPGSEAAFSLRTEPGPWLLDGRGLRLKVAFHPPAPGPFTREVRIDHAAGTDVVPLFGTGLACGEVCRPPHARPRCEAGRCELDGCDAGFFDANGAAEDGCECADGQDPGPTCATALDLGRRSEGAPPVALEGRLHGRNDEDIARFFAEDGFHLFREDFDVRVELTADPGVQMCVYRRPASDPRAACLALDPVCPPDGRYRLRGRHGRSDAADFWIRVRSSGSGPTCPRYRLVVRNG